MYQKTVFDNGVRVLSNFMPNTRSVSICVFVGTGSRYESDTHGGISHFLEHMLFKGTPHRPSSASISNAIERVGGMMNGGTDRELTSYWCKVAYPHFQQALDVLIDMVRNPLLDPGEMAKERGVVQEELSMMNDHPSYRVEAITDEMLWPSHPMGRDVGGSKESVEGIFDQDLNSWFNNFYIPSNVVISIAGNIPHDQAIDAVVPLIERWNGGTTPSWDPVLDRDQTNPTLFMESKKTEQAHLSLSLIGVPNRHTDRYAMDMMNTVLGDGMSSRLFLEVREKRGLTYDIHSSVNHFHDTGSISVSFGVDPKKARYTVQAILEELHRIKVDVSDEDLDRAKELAKGRLLLRMEDSRVVASWAGAQELLYDQVVSVDEVVEKVEAVTIEDVERVAVRYLSPKKFNLAIVGPYRTDRQFQNLLRQ
ncbi:insulinase family protein [Dehalococcoidia bacterium]|nr:insulinase family protein [Dehalococcoidia bacterium]